MTHLFDRICWSSETLTRVETDYVVVYEVDDGPAKVLVPAPEWMAMAMHGGLLPPVEHYHNELRDADGTFVGPRDYWSSYDPIGPMSEEEAIEYLVKKDIPREVWREGSNKRFVICRRSQLPQTRVWRNAWTVK